METSNHHIAQMPTFKHPTHFHPTTTGVLIDIADSKSSHQQLKNQLLNFAQDSNLVRLQQRIND